MSDLFLNKNFSIELGKNGTLKTVSGKQRAKQSVVVHVTESVNEYIGQTENEKEFISGVVSRVARNHPLIDSLRDVSVAKQEGGKYSVRVKYQSDEFSFKVER